MIVDSILNSKRTSSQLLVVLLVVAVVVQRLAGLAMSSLQTLAREYAASAAVVDYLDKAADIDPGYLNEPTYYDKSRSAGDAADERVDSILFGFVGLCGALVGALALVSLLATISPLVAILVSASMIPWIVAERKGFSIVHAKRQDLVPEVRKQHYLRSLVTNGEATAELIASGASSRIAVSYRANAADLLAKERPAHKRQFAIVALGNVFGAMLLIGAFVIAATDATQGHASADSVAATLTAAHGLP